MKRFVKWSAAAVIGLVVVLAAVALALQHWVGSEDFRSRVAAHIDASLGVPVELGAVTVDVWPVPAVALDRVRIASKPPLTLDRVEARPVWAGLLRGRLEVATLLVRDAVVPEQAVAAILAALHRKHDVRDRAGAQPVALAVPLARRMLLDHVTWTPARGAAMTLDAQAQLDDDGLPASAQVNVAKGRFEGASATVQREAPDRWAIKATVGGGTLAGQLQWRTPKGTSSLQGQFETANVEVSALTAPSRTLTGRLQAHTTWHAEFRELDALRDAMQTQTRFTVHNAVVHGVDLAQAVKAAGMSRGGETRLDTLAGHVATHGRAVQLSNLAATSGALSANGTIAISPDKALSGRVTVDLASGAAGGALGVPLAVGGTLDAPTVTLSRGALLGAAIGTAISPGVGTGAGAKLGDRLGETLKGLFGK